MRPFWILFFSLISVVGAEAQPLRVAAAISLREAMQQVGTVYESSGGNKVEFVFGSSGQLLAQIKSGAPIDLFISAANAQVDELVKDNRVVPQSRRIIATNTLVLVIPSDSKRTSLRFNESLAGDDVTRLAIGDPKTVPAGQYAMQVLTKLNLNDKLRDRIVYGANVRQVLSYVERGEVSAGIVYRTDAMESGDKVRVVATADPAMHEPIVYPAVILSDSSAQDAAGKFIKFLASPPAQILLDQKGFSAALANQSNSAR